MISHYKWLWIGLIVLSCHFPPYSFADESETDSTPIEDDQPIDEFPVVSLFHGDIRGFLEKSSKGRSFYSFLGIPYAKPPIGNLRLKVREQLFNIYSYFTSCEHMRVA